MIASDLSVEYQVCERVEATLDVCFDIRMSTVFGWVKGTNGANLPNGRYFIYPKWGAAQVYVADENGYFSFKIAEGAEITIVIPTMMYDRKLTVPAVPVGQNCIELIQIEKPATPERFNFPLISWRP